MVSHGTAGFRGRTFPGRDFRGWSFWGRWWLAPLCATPMRHCRTWRSGVRDICNNDVVLVDRSFRQIPFSRRKALKFSSQEKTNFPGICHFGVVLESFSPRSRVVPESFSLIFEWLFLFKTENKRRIGKGRKGSIHVRYT